MKNLITCLLLVLTSVVAHAQEYSSAFNTLRLPVNSHVSALGGHNISLIEADPSIGWNNPALYVNSSDMSLGLSFMTYAASSSWMGAHFTKALGERHTIAAGAQYMNFGEMDETDESGNQTGRFKAKDIVLGVGYGYLLSDRWSGGANAKILVSNLADYSAVAMSFDVGLNYYDEDNDLSVAASLQNIGTQLKSYDDGLRTHLPFTLEVGFTKGMAHLPVRFSITMTDITRWKNRYYVFPDADENKREESLSFGKKALNHFVVGLDILPTDNLYLSVGYNFRRAYELKAAGSSHWAGLSAGAGLQLKRFQFGLSYAKFHHSVNSLMVNAAYSM